MRGRPRPIRARHVILAWMVIYFPWLPGWPLREWLPTTRFAWVIDANLAAEYALVAISLVVLTGWVGQISLGHAAFVGIGAFTTGLLSRTWGIPFPVSLPIVALVSAGVAALLGVVALRVRGLYLAVATLIFGWMADAYLFSSSWFVGKGGASSIENRVIGDPETLTVFDLSNPRTLYLVMVAAVAAAWYLAVNLRDSKTGRAFFAIRGSEMAAVSLGIDVTRYKLLAFAISGALAGVAGTLVMVDLRSATPVAFQFTISLFYLGIAVVGGITSLGGAVAGSILFAGLTEVFFRVDFLDGWLPIVTVGLLLGVLLGYPGGLGAFGPVAASQIRVRLRGAIGSMARLRAFTRRHLSGSRPTEEEEAAEVDESIKEAEVVESAEASSPEPRRRRRFGFRSRRLTRRTIDLSQRFEAREPTPEELALLEARALASDWRTMDLPARRLPEARADRTSLLEADGVTVRFGGLVAASDVSLKVCEGEIVGLIGPNGAGKTTTFNAIAGLNEPTSGTLRLFGDDVTRVPVHVRAAMGMGRTFQLIQLFPELTVFDNLLVATHGQNPTGVFRHLALTDGAIREEMRARRRVRVVVEMLGLEEIVDRRAAGLPFGILRQVEIGRALVTGSPLLMLDEPASGLDNAETDELMRLLRYLRGELGVSILLIEHDVRMVTAVSDYVYVLNRGAILAEGTPEQIQRNEEVIAAYLGRAVGDVVDPEPAVVG